MGRSMGLLRPLQLPNIHGGLSLTECSPWSASTISLISSGVLAPTRPVVRQTYAVAAEMRKDLDDRRIVCWGLEDRVVDSGLQKL